MQNELSQAELDEIFYGKKPIVTATFYSQEVLDPTASNREGRHVMKVVPFVHLVCIKEAAADIHRPKQAPDEKLWPAAWKAYQESIGGEGSAAVLPGDFRAGAR